jgi:ketosteroid isomerase-like protein
MNESAMTNEAEAVRKVQKARSAALLAADIDAVGPIHAEDFQLITPLGIVLSKREYLGAVGTGVLKYRVLELDSAVDVRFYGVAALTRCRMQIEIDVEGKKYDRAGYWFTDLYEKRQGRWQIVWSQGTGTAG